VGGGGGGIYGNKKLNVQKIPSPALYSMHNCRNSFSFM
jgi:hypothetical protein